MDVIFITGAAGFIGSNLVDRLLAGGKQVVGWDNFSTGQREFLKSATVNPRFKLIEGDCLDLPTLTRVTQLPQVKLNLSALPNNSAQLPSQLVLIETFPDCNFFPLSLESFYAKGGESVVGSSCARYCVLAHCSRLESGTFNSEFAVGVLAAQHG